MWGTWVVLIVDGEFRVCRGSLGVGLDGGMFRVFRGW